jgi:sulfatase modifying factor 1
VNVSQRRAALHVLFACALALPARVSAGDTTPGAGLPLVRIAGGRFRPLYPPAKGVQTIQVPGFRLMTRPVTNAEFLRFVTEHEPYRRDRIARVFADEHYLSHWQGPMDLGPKLREHQPITHVSWFAAKAFCESHGLRLPNEAEWELAAAASEKSKDARKDPTFLRVLLDWYATPSSELPDVPHGRANVYGIHDLHGVIWEWVLDFNNARVVADSREQGDAAKERFCGGGALNASDATDYATFMRLAMRNALQGDYTSSNLGFRCASDATVTTGSRP